MFKARWMALLTIGTLLPAAGLADESTPSETDSEPIPEVTFSVVALQAELWRTSRWRLLPPNDATAYSDDWPQSIADFDFQDSSALGRVSELESLSLLTLAEIGQTRLFLGVDDDGFVGLHFNIFPSDLGENQLEVVRMPYLDDGESDSEAAQLEPESN